MLKKTSILLDKEILEYFKKHKEYNKSEVIRQYLKTFISDKNE